MPRGCHFTPDLEFVSPRQTLKHRYNVASDHQHVYDLHHHIQLLMLRYIPARLAFRRARPNARAYSIPNASGAYSEAQGHLPHSQSPITSKLHFFNSVTEEGKQIPTYRVLDGVGQVLEGAEVPEVRTFMIEVLLAPHCQLLRGVGCIMDAGEDAHGSLFLGVDR